MYNLTRNDDVVIICLYVDDLLLSGSNLKMLEEIKGRMMKEFEMTDLGRLSYFLGMEFKHTAEGVVLHQKKYATEMLKKFDMLKCNPAVTPMEVGLKLVSNSNEKRVDPTLYKQIVVSLRAIAGQISRLLLALLAG